MADVPVRFDSAHADMSELARTALQPVLDSVYRTHAGHMQSDIELVPGELAVYEIAGGRGLVL